MSDTNAVEMLAYGVRKGIDYAMLSIGDNLFNMSMQTPGVTNDHSVNGMILSASTFTYNPFRDPGVISRLSDSVFIYILLALAFCFVYGSYVSISRFKTTRTFLGEEKTDTNDLGKFLKNAALLICLPPVLPICIFFVLIFNKVICSTIMFEAIEGLIPVMNNTTLYVAMAGIYALLTVSFIWRTLIIGMTVSFSFIVAFLAIAPYTRRVGIMIIQYFLLMVFMQPVILMLTACGVAIIQFIVPMGATNTQMVCYMVMGVLLLVVAIVFVIPFPLLRRLGGNGKRMIKLVT